MNTQVSFDDFSDQVESYLMQSLGWTEIQVADFTSPRILRLIQCYKEGTSVLETASVLQSTPAETHCDTGDLSPFDCIYRITHRYDIGDRSTYIEGPPGLDVRRAAVYIQFMAEEWFGDHKSVTNLGIAAALVSFYGCKHASAYIHSEHIDMHDDREALCGQFEAMQADPRLLRQDLREFISKHVEG